MTTPAPATYQPESCPLEETDFWRAQADIGFPHVMVRIRTDPPKLATTTSFMVSYMRGSLATPIRVLPLQKDMDQMVDGTAGYWQTRSIMVGDDYIHIYGSVWHTTGYYARFPYAARARSTRYFLRTLRQRLHARYGPSCRVEQFLPKETYTPPWTLRIAPDTVVAINT